MMQEEQPLQVARCTKIIAPNTDDAKYVINVKQIAKFVVALGDRVAPTDIEEGMRVGVDRNKYQIQIPLPPKIDPTVTMMTSSPSMPFPCPHPCPHQTTGRRSSSGAAASGTRMPPGSRLDGSRPRPAVTRRCAPIGRCRPGGRSRQPPLAV